jgi:hypothetical protein
MDYYNSINEIEALAILEQNRYILDEPADVPAFFEDQGVISWRRIHCGS